MRVRGNGSVVRRKNRGHGVTRGLMGRRKGQVMGGKERRL
jgi:hypothetical protein